MPVGSTHFTGARLIDGAGGPPIEHSTGARLIDGAGGPPIEDSQLTIDGDRIVSVGNMDPASLRATAGARVIVCDGETIMPSLICDHNHPGVVKGTPGKIGPIGRIGPI